MHGIYEASAGSQGTDENYTRDGHWAEEMRTQCVGWGPAITITRVQEHATARSREQRIT